MAVAAPQEYYLEQFSRRVTERRSEPEWLRSLRTSAIERFAEEGFPTTRHEEWRFTNVAPLAQAQFEKGSLARGFVGANGHGTPATRIVFVNGRFAAESSVIRGLPQGAILTSLETAWTEHPALVRQYLSQAVRMPQHGFTALNTAFMEDGAFVYFPEGATFDEPIYLTFFSSTDRPTDAHARLLIAAGDDSRLRIVESYTGTTASPYFTNVVTEIIAGQRSVIDHYKRQQESLNAYHVSSTHILLQGDSRFTSHNIVLGGGLVRNDVNACLDGEGIVCTLNGLYLVDGERLVDNHTAIDHAKPHCESHEVYKGVLDGRGRGVFNGKIFVRQDAQKTDAKQTNKALLLSDDATINTKPQLEIFADDVKCTHGATVGQIDAEQMFYLRSRGIGHAEARALLIHAFAEDIIERIEVEPLKSDLEQTLLSLLPV